MALFTDRVSEFPNRRKLTVIDIQKDAVTDEITELTVDSARDEGSVSQEGTPLSATNMNKLAEKTGSFVANNLVSANDTSGNIKNSGIPQANVVTQSANGATGQIPSYSGANKVLVNSGVVAANVVQQTANGVYSNIPVYANDSKILTNSGKRITDLQVYDLVIRTQAQFAEAYSSNWLSAKSILVVGGGGDGTNGAYTLPTNGITLPLSYDTFKGINGCHFEWNVTGNTQSEAIGINGSVNISTSLYGFSMSNFALIIKGTKSTNETVGLKNALNVENVAVMTVSATLNNFSGFISCDNLTNCTGTGSSGDGYGFLTCTNLTNCTGTGTGTSSGYGFYSCTNLTNCTGTGTGSSGYGYGFLTCTNLTNCTGTGTGSSGDGYGFNGCTNLTNCTGTGTGTSSGYGFYLCTRASNCRDGGSSANMWGADNYGIDEASCNKTPAKVNNSTLNT